MYDKIVKSWKKINIKGNYQNNIANKKILHKNSAELVQILSKHNIGVSPVVLEIGCGCGRNLQYISESLPKSILFGNDLVKSECFKYMDKDLAAKMKFYSEDTLSFMRSNYFPVNLLLASDHIMHLDPKSAQEVILLIRDKWKPEKIMTRSTTKNVPKKGRWVHNFSVFETDYSLTECCKSEQDNKFEIKLWERNLNFGEELSKKFYRTAKNRCFDYSKYCDKVEIIFDVGACVGSYSLNFDKYFDCKIYAFEPVTSNYNVLRNNLKSNKPHRVECFNIGFWSSEQKISLGYPPGRDHANTGLFSVFGTEKMVECQFDVMDHWADRRGVYPDLIKIDTEGAEYEILKCSSKCLDHARYVVCENNVIYNENNRELSDFLQGHGFKEVPSISRGNDVFWEKK